MIKEILVGVALAFGLGAETVAKNDYTDPANWLCRPGRQDACSVNLDATVIAADGSMTREVFRADPDAPIDCFYVYPTVSTDPGLNSSMVIKAEERTVVLHQFARFGSRCRLYAPKYRQITLAGLTARLGGQVMPGDPTTGYHDVLDAWNEYLSHDNRGRGVVLIGHSQGSSVLLKLIAAEIDGKPVQAKLVSAILMGTSVQIPKGADVGGTFKSIPLCRSAAQTGCVITFSSYRADPPPPANSRFGASQGETVAACVNPAALGGGAGDLKSYLPARHRFIVGGATGPDWTDPPNPVETPFVRVPGLLTAECVANEHNNYLAISTHPTPGGGRTNQISGDLVFGGQVLKDWGLHLIDVNLAIGNLLDAVGEETKAYLAKRTVGSAGCARPRLRAAPQAS